MRSIFLITTTTLVLLGTTAYAWLYDTTSVDCLQSQWTEWMKVGYNTRLRSRVILRHPSNGGTGCGPNEETEQLPAGETITPQETARAFDTFFLKGQTSLTRSPEKERDLLVILDESGSITAPVFYEARDALGELLGYICPGIGPNYPYHQVAFMTFSSRFTEHFDFNDYGTYAGVSNAISQVTYSSGGTATHEALDFARTTMFANGDFSVSTKGLRSGSLKEVLLITDGQPNDASATVAAAQRLQNIGVSVFALGIGNVVNSHMEQLVSEPEYKHIFHLESFDDFHTMVEAVESVYSTGERCVNLNPWSRRGVA